MSLAYEGLQSAPRLRARVTIAWHDRGRESMGERAHATFEYPVSRSMKATIRYGLGLGCCHL